MIAFAFALFFTVALIWFIVAPHFIQNKVALASSSGEEKARSDQRERCLQALSDLELDFATAKLSESEYQSMKRQTEEELEKL